jgi:hypothetical protein
LFGIVVVVDETTTTNSNNNNNEPMTSITIPLSHDVLLYVLLPMLEFRDAIHFIQTSQHYYHYFYAKYEVRHDIQWNDTLKQCMQLIQKNHHPMPLIRTIICTIAEQVQPTELYPSTIEKMKVSASSSFRGDAIVAGMLPNNLKSLHLQHNVSFPKKGLIPAGLVEFDLTRFNCRLFTYDNFHNIMTPNLKKLVFGVHFNLQLLPGMLPNTLEYLDMGVGTNTVLSGYITRQFTNVTFRSILQLTAANWCIAC